MKWIRIRAEQCRKTVQSWTEGARQSCLNSREAGSALLSRLLKDIGSVICWNEEEDETVLYLPCTCPAHFRRRERHLHASYREAVKQWCWQSESLNWKVRMFPGLTENGKLWYYIGFCVRPKSIQSYHFYLSCSKINSKWPHRQTYTRSQTKRFVGTDNVCLQMYNADENELFCIQSTIL